MKPRPKRQWHLRNGATGRPGPGRPARPAKVEPRALHFDKYGDKLEKKNGAGKDMAAEIARQVFEQNPDAIYKAMSKKLMKGDHRAFQALANRAYGLPAQEVAYSGKAPLTVEINFLGQRRRESLGVEKALDAGKTIEGEAQEAEEEPEEDAEL